MTQRRMAGCGIEQHQPELSGKLLLFFLSSFPPMSTLTLLSCPTCSLITPNPQPPLLAAAPPGRLVSVAAAAAPPPTPPSPSSPPPAPLRAAVDVAAAAAPPPAVVVAKVSNRLDQYSE